MKTNVLVLCVEDLRLAVHRRLPLSASASKEKNMVEKRKQQWRKVKRTGGEGTGKRWGMEERFGLGRAEFFSGLLQDEDVGH